MRTAAAGACIDTQFLQDPPEEAVPEAQVSVHS